jgi:hypothetical protein
MTLSARVSMLPEESKMIVTSVVTMAALLSENCFT